MAGWRLIFGGREGCSDMGWTDAISRRGDTIRTRRDVSWIWRDEDIMPRHISELGTS